MRRSNIYPKHMFYEEIRKKKKKKKTRPFLHIKESLQKHIHFNDSNFGNKCYRRNEGSLYISVN